MAILGGATADNRSPADRRVMMTATRSRLPSSAESSERRTGAPKVILRMTLAFSSVPSDLRRHLPSRLHAENTARPRGARRGAREARRRHAGRRPRA